MNSRNSYPRPYLPNVHFPFSNPLHEQKREALRASKKIIKPLRPHFRTMDLLSIDRDITGVYDTFGSSGVVLREVVEQPCFKRIIEDFYASFELVMEGGIPVGWNFIIEGVEYRLSKLDIKNLLSFTYYGPMPSYSAEQQRAFWDQISNHSSQTCRFVPQEIKSFKWRYIHQLVALNINTRLSKGAVVAKQDLDIMQMMYNRVPIDMFTIYSEKFERMSAVGNVSRVLGCTSIITALARGCGVHFCGCTHGKFTNLNIPRLMKRNLIGPAWNDVFAVSNAMDYCDEDTEDEL